MKTWIENELKGCEFPDVRLGNRFIIDPMTPIGRRFVWMKHPSNWWPKAVVRFPCDPA